MPINRAQIKKQLQEGLNTVFGLEYKQYPDQWADIFVKSTESKKAYVEDVLMTGFGAAPVKAEGAGVSYESAGEGWMSRYVFETVALAFSITEEAQEDDLYGNLGAQMSKALAKSMKYTKNVKGANILNYAMTAGYTGGDGKVLLATDHPLRSGATGANTLTTQADLSETAIEDMLTLMGNTTDDRGIPMPIMAKRLIIPNGSQFLAKRILFSDGRVGTADNDLNAVKSMGLIPASSVNNFLTDLDSWYITTDVNDGLKYIERVSLKKGIEGDFETGNMRYKARERYVFGFSDWRGVFGSVGS